MHLFLSSSTFQSQLTLRKRDWRLTLWSRNSQIRRQQERSYVHLKSEVWKATSKALLFVLLFHSFPIFPTSWKSCPFLMSWDLTWASRLGNTRWEGPTVQAKRPCPATWRASPLPQIPLFLENWTCPEQIPSCLGDQCRLASPRAASLLVGWCQDVRQEHLWAGKETRWMTRVWIVPRSQGLKKKLIGQGDLEEPLFASCFHLI